MGPSTIQSYSLLDGLTNRMSDKDGQDTYMISLHFMYNCIKVNVKAPNEFVWFF